MQPLFSFGDGDEDLQIPTSAFGHGSAEFVIFGCPFCGGIDVGDPAVGTHRPDELGRDDGQVCGGQGTCHLLTIDQHTFDIGFGTFATNDLPQFVNAVPIVWHRAELTFTKHLNENQQPGKAELDQLAGHLLDAKRFTELSVVNQVLRDLAGAAERQMDSWRSRLIQQGGPEEAARRLSLRQDGGLSLPLNGIPINNLDFVKGLPITGIHIDTTLALNLKPLAGLPLKSLRLRAPAVTDLSSIKGKKLDELTIFDSRIRDFTVLEDMPLKSVELEGHDLKSIEFLRNSSLTNLVVNRNRELSDFSPLAGKPIVRLWMNQTAAADLEFAKDLPLTELSCESTKITDLRPLQGAPLQFLALSGNVTDLAPLAGAPLWYLWTAGGGKLHDISPLKDAKLMEVYLPNNLVTDLSPLAGQPLRALRILAPA